jgi:hypothetical protein
MSQSHPAPFYHEPTHDEIALCAYLTWEKQGRAANQEMNCWLEAQAQLRATRQQEAEIAATKAARPWPPSPLVAAKTETRVRTVSKPAKTKLAARGESRFAVKPKRASRAAASSGRLA